MHSHPMSLHMPASYNTFEFWVEGIDEHWLPIMDECWVFMDTGWDISRGVKHEIDWFKEHDKPIKYIDPVTYDMQEEIHATN